MDRTEMRMQNQEAALKSLENQVSQISQVLKSRPMGGFPSDTEVAKGDTDNPTQAETPASAGEDHNIPTGPEEAEITAAAPQPKQPREDTLEEPRSPPQFPQRLKKQKHEYQYKNVFDILKHVHINLPLVEALQQMPNYAKFLKDMVSRKTRIGEFETVAATEVCLAMMHNKKLGIGEAMPTTVMLQLADRLHVQPEGRIKDILVRVEKFIFPADFLILDCETDEHAPIILGRPFLATSRMCIFFPQTQLSFKSLRFSEMAGEFSARFANTAAEEHYDHIVIRKSLWEEQGFKYDDGLDNYGLETIIHKRLNDLGWLKFGRQPARANIN
ncbi:hypothetical protein V6N13_024624 [Hibiscus sabdariffa]